MLWFNGFPNGFGLFFKLLESQKLFNNYCSLKNRVNSKIKIVGSQRKIRYPVNRVIFKIQR